MPPERPESQQFAAIEQARVHALETVIEAMDVGIALVGPDDRLTLANSALSRIATGPLATRQDLEAAIGGQLRDGQFESSGPNRWIAIRTYDVGDPDGPSTLVIARDVTERRRAEASQDQIIFKHAMILFFCSIILLSLCYSPFTTHQFILFVSFLQDWRLPLLWLES